MEFIIVPEEYIASICPPDLHWNHPDQTGPLGVPSDLHHVALTPPRGETI